MKKPLLQRKWVWIVIILFIFIGYSEIKTRVTTFQNNRKEEQLTKKADEILKGKIKVPDPYFKDKNMIEKEFKSLGFKPVFVISNFDSKGEINNRTINKNECDQLVDQESISYYGPDKVGEKYGFYADKGATITIGYSDHDYDINKINEKTKPSKEKDKKKEAKAKLSKEKEKEMLEEKRKADRDITKLADTANDEQREVLSLLASQQFETQYPYKGSKMHTIIGVIQDWTQLNGTWYYKVDGTIVNAFNSEREANIEIHITPTGPESGVVEIIDY